MSLCENMLGHSHMMRSLQCFCRFSSCSVKNRWFYSWYPHEAPSYATIVSCGMIRITPWLCFLRHRDDKSTWIVQICILYIKIWCVLQLTCLVSTVQALLYYFLAGGCIGEWQGDAVSYYCFACSLYTCVGFLWGAPVVQKDMQIWWDQIAIGVICYSVVVCLYVCQPSDRLLTCLWCTPLLPQCKTVIMQPPQPCKGSAVMDDE